MFAGKSKQWFDELIYVLLYIYVQVFICKMSSPQQHVKTLTVCVSLQVIPRRDCPWAAEGWERAGLSLSCFLPP